MRERFVFRPVAEGVLVIVIVAFLPLSGGNVASSLWAAVGGGHYTLAHVNAHLAVTGVLPPPFRAAAWRRYSERLEAPIRVDHSA
jgi:hypothetical protein